jgi:hypothetical protein
MTGCTQPGCTGTIVDGYCDVCGSPAGAALFVPAEASASAGSPAPAGEHGLMAVGSGSGFPPEPKDGGLNTACMQPGCTGTIVDGHCDVCGSSAGARPLVPAEAAASAASPTPAAARRTAVRRGVVVAAILFLLGCALVLYQVAPSFLRSRPSTTVSSAPTTVRTHSASPGGEAAEGETIQLGDLVNTARPFETVRVQGTYHGGANTFLRVQRSEGGKWLAFPIPTKTDQSGRFTAYVEFGQPGRYRLRVLHPGSGVTSKSFVLVIKR